MKIDDRYYNELVNSGTTVPRDIKTGETLMLGVGEEYIITSSDKSKPPVRARNTQNCPCHLKLI